MTSLCDLQAQFQSRIDTIKGICRFQFRQLDPAARDEAEANTLGLAWKYYLQLAKQGKHEDDAVFNSMVYHATRHTRLGRMPQGQARAKDVLDYAQRKLRGVNIEPIDLNFFIGKSAPVPNQAAFRIDVPAFLATLSDKNK